MKVHQPNLPAPEFQHKSPSKSKYADSVVENDTRIGRIMDKVRALGLDKNTYVFWTTDNGAWQDVYPDAGYTPFRGTKGTDREGGSRVPSIAWGPGIKAEQQERGDPRRPRLHGNVCRARRSASCRENDREGKPIIFDSYDLTPVLFGTGKSPRNSWFYFTENELTPGAARVGNYKAVFNLRGGDGEKTGGLAVDSNLGWKGPEQYVATVPQVFDLWQDPQERYDMFMNNYTEHTWILVTINACGQGTDADVHEVSAAQTAERRLYRADHAIGLSALPVRPRRVGERRHPASAPDRKLIADRDVGRPGCAHYPCRPAG